MKPLTATQRQVLTGAARHPHGLAVPPPKLPPAPRIAVAKALLAAGLLTRAEDTEQHDASLAWTLDGERMKPPRAPRKGRRGHPHGRPSAA